MSAETFPEIRGAGSAILQLWSRREDEQVAQDYTFQNNVTKIVGKHTLKFGYETGPDDLRLAGGGSTRRAYTTWRAANGRSPRIPATVLPTCCWAMLAVPSLLKWRPVAAALVVALVVRADGLEADSDADTQPRNALVLRDPVPN